MKTDSTHLLPQLTSSNLHFLLPQMNVTSQRFIAPEKTKLPVSASVEKSSSLDIFQLALDSGNLLKKKTAGATPSSSSSSSSSSKSRLSSSSSLSSNLNKSLKKKLSIGGSDATPKTLTDGSISVKTKADSTVTASSAAATSSSSSKDTSKKYGETLPASYHRKSSVLGKYKIPKRPEDEQPDQGVAPPVTPKIDDVAKAPVIGPNVFTTNLREQFANLSKDARGPSSSAAAVGAETGSTTPSSPAPKTNIFQRFHNNKEDPVAPGRVAAAPTTAWTPKPNQPAAPPKVDAPKTNNFWSMMRPSETVVVKAADSGVSVTEASSSSSSSRGNG